MEDKEQTVQESDQGKLEYTADDYALKGEKIDKDYSPKRFHALSPVAQKLYVEHVEEGNIRKEYELLDGFEEHEEALQEVVKGRNRVFTSKDGKKILKIQECLELGYKNLAEGPTIRVVRDIMRREGRDVDLVPEVIDYGITDKGNRYTITKKVEGERVFQPEFKFRSPEQKPPTTDEFLKLIETYSDILPILENYGIYKVADTKQEDTFLTSDRKLRFIDWEVIWTGIKPYEELVSELYRNAAINFLDLVTGTRPTAAEVRKDIGDLDAVSKFLEDVEKEALDRILLASLLQFLAGQHNIKATHLSTKKAVSFYHQLKAGKEVDEDGISKELSRIGGNYIYLKSAA